MKVRYISKHLARLQEELARNPELQKECKEYETFGEVMGFLAAQVGLALDGAYTENDIDNIADVIVKRLAKKQSPIILLDDIKNVRGG